MVIIGIDVDDGFFKGTAVELGFTEEDVLEEEDSETVPEVDGDSEDCDRVVATVFEVVATVVEVRTTVRVTVLKMTIDPRSRKSICSKMTSK